VLGDQEEERLNLLILENSKVIIVDDSKLFFPTTPRHSFAGGNPTRKGLVSKKGKRIPTKFLRENDEEGGQTRSFSVSFPLRLATESFLICKPKPGKLELP